VNNVPQNIPFSNPFSTRFTRPGEIPYQFVESEELGTLVDRFGNNRWVGQIVGPHGCGKTTLCHLLARELKHLFPKVNHVTIRSGRDIQSVRAEHSPALELDRRVQLKPNGSVNHALKRTLTIVDGVERLSLLQQRMLVSNLSGPRNNHALNGQFTPDQTTDGLLITSHRRLKFVPVLLSITPSVATFQSVAKFLDPSLEMTQREFAEAFAAAGHNIREAIMLLYDRHEALRKSRKLLALFVLADPMASLATEGTYSMSVLSEGTSLSSPLSVDAKSWQANGERAENLSGSNPLAGADA